MVQCPAPTTRALPGDSPAEKAAISPRVVAPDQATTWSPLVARGWRSSAPGQRPLRTAVLLLAHGAAEEMDALEAYYTHILHGRPPPAERLADLRQRYAAIGGASPFNRLIRWQAAQCALHLRRQELPSAVYLGFQHTPPFIAEAVQALLADGAQRALVLLMTPFYSPMGTGGYAAAVERCARDAGLEFSIVRGWSAEVEFLDLLERRLRARLQQVRAAVPGTCHVAFTAHSLPARAHENGDPYPRQFTAAAHALAARVRPPRWSVCYQSASQTGERWLGPDILEEMEAAAQTGARSVVVCPLNFTADNLEVLYDLGIAATHRARDLGIHVAYVEPFNTDPAFPRLLATLVARQFAAQDGGTS